VICDGKVLTEGGRVEGKEEILDGIKKTVEDLLRR